jgi:hypothetical protein
MSEYLELKDLPKDQLSFSQFNMYKRCPLQYKFRYVDGLKIPPAGALIAGTSVHAALEHDLGQKISTQENLKTESVLEIFSDAFEKNVAEVVDTVGDVDWGKDTKYKGKEKQIIKKTKAQVKDGSIKGLECYHKRQAINITPIEVEKQFEIPVGNNAYTLVGRTDLLHDMSGLKVLTDFKTTSRYTPQKITPEQLVVYQHACPEAELLTLDVINITKQDYAIEEFQKVDEDRLKLFLDNLNAVALAIKAQLFYPVTGFGCMNCSMCGYRQSHCDLWKGVSIG